MAQASNNATNRPKYSNLLIRKEIDEADSLDTVFFQQLLWNFIFF